MLLDKAVRDQITTEVRALPFLGRLTHDWHEIVAGETTELVLDYEVGASGIADSGWLKLCMKFYSDWEWQTDDPTARDYCSVEYITGSRLGKAFRDTTSTLQSVLCRYDEKGGERPFQKALIVDLVDGYLRPGDHLVFRLGDRRAGGPGTRVQTFVERDFAFRLWVDLLGTSRFALADEIKFDVVPGPAQHLLLSTSRLVRPGESCAVNIHTEDQWGNTPIREGATVTLRTSGVMTTETNYALPADDWATRTVQLTSEEPGEVRVDAVTADGRLAAEPVYIEVSTDSPAPRALFGDLHVHTNDTVGTNDNAYNFAYGRRIGALDFLGYTANDFQITDERWEAVVDLADEVTVEGEFVCFPGVEWCGTPGVGGDHNVVYIGGDTTLARCLEWHEGLASKKPEVQHWPITMLYDAYEGHPERYLLIPHVGGRRAILDWHHPELERLIEVHSTYGPDDWFFEDAMERGLRLGATGASDEHRGRPGGGKPGANIFGASGGMCGLVAPALTREAVGTALRARHTWATTGEKLAALLWSGEHMMGDDVPVADDHLVLNYQLLGNRGWEEITCYDGNGLIWRRDMHAEQGYSESRIRIRWGGARVRDRYRWATWHGTARVRHSRIDDVRPWAFEHPEKLLRRLGSDGVEWLTETYGASNGAVMNVRDLSKAVFEISGEIPNFLDTPDFTMTVTGDELMATGSVCKELGGIGLFVALERLCDEPLPVKTEGSFEVRPRERGGSSVVYVRGRQANGHEVWTSPMFIDWERSTT
ncbi:MAG: hypothetical protein GEU71_15005 [Actinobacteria bacterium]|nr:hypothetical protein [Actinomycetota bacterium]